MNTAFFFQNNKIEFDGEEKREKTNETSWRKLSIGTWIVFCRWWNSVWGNESNKKLICKHGKWKMILYANQEGNITRF